MSTDLSKTDVVILCGGRGERLRSVVKKQPKVLAEVKGKAFLDILIDNVLRYGFKHIILSVGYLREQIKNHFSNYKNYDITFSEEEEPLGTGGALKKAENLIMSNHFMVMNGDSICKVDFKSFFDFHIKKEALLSIVLVRSKTTQDYGSVTLNDSQRIAGFNEKVVGGSENIINAGIYLMTKDIFSYMPEQDSFSLEYDLFPKIVNDRCYGFLTDSEFLDIGIPERYEKARRMIK